MVVQQVQNRRIFLYNLYGINSFFLLVQKLPQPVRCLSWRLAGSHPFTVSLPQRLVRVNIIHRVYLPQAWFKKKKKYAPAVKNLSVSLYLCLEFLSRVVYAAGIVSKLQHNKKNYLLIQQPSVIKKSLDNRSESQPLFDLQRGAHKTKHYFSNTLKSENFRELTRFSYALSLLFPFVWQQEEIK